MFVLALIQLLVSHRLYSLQFAVETMHVISLLLLLSSDPY